ncbi:hypothetical protein CPC08DRAFT_714944 [Agrocybe pediades]|nr:hypothetical protein CPC08DRAFT_714944 [Agrocybe pediades]
MSNRYVLFLFPGYRDMILVLLSPVNSVVISLVIQFTAHSVCFGAACLLIKMLCFLIVALTLLSRTICRRPVLGLVKV